MAANKVPSPPPGLAARGRRFWRSTLADHELEPAELEVLLEVCRLADRLDELDAAIKRDGVTTLGSTGQLRAHPAIGEHRGCALALGRLLSQLALEDEQGKSMPSAASLRGRKAAAVRWGRGPGARSDAQARRR